MRERWGCDVPTELPQTSTLCPRCVGNDPACGDCKGEGRVLIYRCPRALNDSLPANRVCEYVGMLEAGILPVAGGWEDQSATFAAAARIAMAARAEIEERSQQLPPGVARRM